MNGSCRAMCQVEKEGRKVRGSFLPLWKRPNKEMRVRARQFGGNHKGKRKKREKRRKKEEKEKEIRRNEKWTSVRWWDKVGK